jgi:hypothetical protein
LRCRGLLRRHQIRAEHDGRNESGQHLHKSTPRA